MTSAVHSRAAFPVNTKMLDKEELKYHGLRAIKSTMSFANTVCLEEFSHDLVDSLLPSSGLFGFLQVIYSLAEIERNVCF